MWHSGFQFSHVFLLHVTWIFCGNQPSKQHQPNIFLARHKFGNTCFMCLIRRVANIIRFLHFAHLAICCSRFAREWDLNSEQGMPLKPSVFHQSRNWNSLGPRRDHKKEAKELYTPSLSSWPVYCGGALLQRWIMVEVDYANLSGVSLVQSSTPQTWKVLVCEGGRRFLMPPLFCASSQPNWLR